MCACASAAVMHTNAKIKNLYFCLFSSIYDVHIFMHKYIHDFSFPLFVFCCLLTAEIDLTHHKVAAFVMLVACYSSARSPPLPHTLPLLMARCCCLLDFNILAANKYAIRNEI